MSLKAIVWVMEEAPVTNHGHLALLYALADRANDDGQAAWPTQEWLAKRCRVSTRTVRRYLSELEESGIIVRGDQRLVDFIDARRRPVVWDIVMDFRADNSDFRPDKTEDLGRTDCPVKDSWPDNPRQLGRTTGVLQTVLKPSIKDITPYSPPTRRRDDEQPQQGDPQAGTPTKKPTKKQLDEEFEFFWARVEKKRAKQQARKSFEKQRRTHSLDFICSQLERAQAEWRRTGRDPQYWPHPSTWLNSQLEDDYEIVQESPAQQSRVGGYQAAAERLKAKIAEGGHQWAVE